MSKKTIEVETFLLQKFAEFTKVVLSELNNLRTQLNTQMKKEATYDSSREEYINSVEKIAEVLHHSDYDFIIGKSKKEFINKAASDPQFVAEAFEKVCEASGVSLIGRPARVAASRKVASYDPVYAKAFGYNPGGNITDLED